MPPIIAEKPENNYKRVAPGTYVARCYSMIELGTHTEEYLGQSKTLKKVNITWELPTELETFKEENGPEPFVVSKDYNLSMFEKANLRKDLESWRGKGFTEEEAQSFDITKLVGVECMLSIIDNPSKDGSKTYSKITSISRLPKGMTCPPQFNKSRVLSFDNFDVCLFNSLPDFIKTKIINSVEYKQVVNPQLTESQPEQHPQPTDDLPF